MFSFHRSVSKLVAVGSALLLAVGMSMFGATAAFAAPDTDIELVPGAPESADSFVEYDGLLYFSGFNGSDSVLFSFDGTTSTEVVGGGVPSPSGPFSPLVYDGVLYFGGYDGGYALFSWDGTDFAKVSDVAPAFSSDSPPFVVYNGLLYFTEWDLISDYVLHSWDGTDVEIVLGGGTAPTTTAPNAFTFVVYGGVLYFGANGSGNALYSWDGADFATVTGSGDPAPTDVDSFIVYNGVLYFEGWNGSAYVLYSWDGTAFTVATGGGDPAPTQVDSPVVYAGALYFVGFDGVPYLYSWDGTDYTKITGGAGSAPTPTYPDELIVYDGVLYFNADGAVSGTLHSWDGSVFTVYPDPPFSLYSSIVYNGVLYLSGEDAAGNELLWSLRHRSDPALAATGAEASVPLGIAGASVIAGALILLTVRRRKVSLDR